MHSLWPSTSVEQMVLQAKSVSHCLEDWTFRNSHLPHSVEVKVALHYIRKQLAYHKGLFWVFTQHICLIDSAQMSKVKCLKWAGLLLQLQSCSLIYCGSPWRFASRLQHHQCHGLRKCCNSFRKRAQPGQNNVMMNNSMFWLIPSACWRWYKPASFCVCNWVNPL